MRGPAGTPYHKGIYKFICTCRNYTTGIYLLFAKFPENYPYKPPEIRFITPVRIFSEYISDSNHPTQIYHCNINSMGRICHPVLGRNYIPSLSMREVFDQVYGLLMSPEADDPLDRYILSHMLSYKNFDSILAEEFHTNTDGYYKKAQQLNGEKACHITWEEYKKVFSNCMYIIAPAYC